jgi:hypothetical protein
MGGKKGCRSDAAGATPAAVVEMARVTVAGLAPGVTAAGENVQVAKAGKPEH